MLPGRKLLLADDSLAIQKVIDLTFTDEGMEDTAVGDTEHALEAIDRIAPDMVLADVFMPGGGGYELCERIKQSERFGRIPVMLLIGSFEPFDEAEARRVGADDVVTKPFQSIRQLVNRVGSLLGGKGGDDNPTAHQYSTLGIGQTESAEARDHSNVKVFIEAPVMKSLETEEMPEKICEPDIETQTADTMKLSAVDGEDASAGFESSSTNNNSGQQTMQTHGSDNANNSFLDLDGAGGVVATEVAGDFVLDLEDDPALEVSSYSATAVAVPALDEMATEPFAEPVEPPPAEIESAATISPAFIEDEPQDLAAPLLASSELSPQAIDAIARRVVEQLSEKVVREIAWEVVPELAELLIKQKLDEQN